ncbi:MAG: hypothetical protein ACRDQZ_18940 [Mycobacteriales bacterium]
MLTLLAAFVPFKMSSVHELYTKKKQGEADVAPRPRILPTRAKGYFAE